VKERLGQRGLCGVPNHGTLDTELTRIVAARVHCERRIATACLAPAIVTPSVVESGLGTTMLLHDTVGGNGGGREEDECNYKSGFHCGIWTYPIVRSLLLVDHRLWLDLLCIYMSVVSGDGLFYHHDKVL